MHAMNRAIALIQSLPDAAIALSGGTDSALLAYLAGRELGERAAAYTITSALTTGDDLEAARAAARIAGIAHHELPMDAFAIPEIAHNDPERCYHCKRAVITLIMDAARTRGIGSVLDGSNADDAHEHRPGARAAKELGVIAPFALAGVTKEMIRTYSRERNLPWADRPSSPCLATRFPYRTELSIEALAKVEQAERFLRERGFAVVRVRSIRNTAIVEVPRNDIARMNEIMEEFSRQAHAAGFHGASVSPEGYRSGAMDQIQSRHLKM